MNRIAIMLVVSAAAVHPGHARAEAYDTCTGFIASVPAVIGTQGLWCLTADLATAASNGVAITIDANNVTIDCNGYKLGGLGAGLGTLTDGIRATARGNATVRNCSIRGFYRGVVLLGTNGGHLVEDNRFDGNTFAAIHVEGDGSLVRRNRVLDTGGSTQGPGYAVGIYAKEGMDVIDNVVDGSAPTFGVNGNAYGIYVESSSNATVTGNRIRNLVPEDSGSEWAIYMNNSGTVSIVGNIVVATGAENGIGLRCTSSLGVARDNVVHGFTTPINACTDVDNTY